VPGFILDWQRLDADRNVAASAVIMRGDPALMRKMLTNSSKNPWPSRPAGTTGLPGKLR
jgi:hypothetical protein